MLFLAEFYRFGHCCEPRRGADSRVTTDHVAPTSVRAPLDLLLSSILLSFSLHNISHSSSTLPTYPLIHPPPTLPALTLFPTPSPYFSPYHSLSHRSSSLPTSPFSPALALFPIYPLSFSFSLSIISLTQSLIFLHSLHSFSFLPPRAPP